LGFGVWGLGIRAWRCGFRVRNLSLSPPPVLSFQRTCSSAMEAVRPLTCIPHTHAHTHTRTHARSHTRTHARSLAHTHTHTAREQASERKRETRARAHTHTHKHTHTHTHTHTPRARGLLAPVLGSKWPHVHRVPSSQQRPQTQSTRRGRPA
jgi:hypothetical protein